MEKDFARFDYSRIEAKKKRVNGAGAKMLKYLFRLYIAKSTYAYLLRRTFSHLAWSGVPLFFVIAFSVAVLFVPQGREIIRALTDSQALDQSIRYAVWLIAALSLWSLSTYQWARVRFEYHHNSDPNPDRIKEIDDQISSLLLRLLTSIPFAVLSFSFIANGVSPQNLVQGPLWVVFAIMTAIIAVLFFSFATIKLQWLAGSDLDGNAEQKRQTLALVVLASVGGVVLAVPFWSIAINSLTFTDANLASVYLDWKSLFLLIGFVAVPYILVFIFSASLKQSFAQWHEEANGQSIPSEQVKNPFFGRLQEVLHVSETSFLIIVLQIAYIALLTLLLNFLPVPISKFVGPGAIVALAFVGMMPIFSIVAILSHNIGTPVLVVVLIWLIAASGFRNFIGSVNGCAKPDQRCHQHQVRGSVAHTREPSDEKSDLLNMEDYRLPLLEMIPSAEVSTSSLQNDTRLQTVRRRVQECDSDKINSPSDAVMFWAGKVGLCTNYWAKDSDAASQSNMPTSEVKTRKQPIVFISASGGGQRAAIWANYILSQIHVADPEVTRHTFSISAVSGGALGVATFISSLVERPEELFYDDNVLGADPLVMKRQFVQQGSSVLFEDSLSPALAGLFFRDTLSYFSPMPLSKDRAGVLEAAWEEAWLQRSGKILSTDLRSNPNEVENLPPPWRTDIDEAQVVLTASSSFWKSGEPEVTFAIDSCRIERIFKSDFLCAWTQSLTDIPNVFFNGVHEQSGRRILTSNVEITESLRNTIDFFDVHDTSISLSTAVHNSARFPIISPAGVLSNKGNINGSIIDGGYADNSGSLTTQMVADTVLIELSERYPDVQFIPIFVEITNDTAPELREFNPLYSVEEATISRDYQRPQRLFQDDQKTTHLSKLGVSFEPAFGSNPLIDELLSPLRGVLGVRGRVGADASQDLLEYARTLSEEASPISNAIAETRYVQFRLCNVEERDTPAGWMQTISQKPTYECSFPSVLEPDEPSCKAEDFSFSLCVRANQRAFRTLTESVASR